MLSSVKITFVGFFLIPILGGCALQSSLVNLEQELQREIEKAEKLEDNLATLRKKVDSLPKEVKSEKTSGNNQKAITNLLGEISSIKSQLNQLEGRIEEEGRKASEAMRTADDQVHEVRTFSGRLSVLEKRIPVEENKPAGVNSPLVPPTEAYTLAYNDYLRGNYDLAIMSFKNYIEQYPNATSLPQALYWVGQSYYNKGTYADAVTYFEQIETKFPKHDMVPNAMLKRGISLIELSKLDLAKSVLKQIIERYPQSSEADLAKDKLATLQ